MRENRIGYLPLVEIGAVKLHRNLEKNDETAVG